MKKIVSGIVVLFLISIFSCKEKTPSSFDTQLEPIIQEVIKQQNIPGLAIAIVENGSVVYERGFGVMNLKKSSNEISPLSVFHMASITKMFVASAIMQLVEQGKIDLDSTILNYLPYFKMKDGRYSEITIRQMLSHTSGMPDERNYEWDNPQYDKAALERYVLSLKNRSMDAVPGSSFEYSNIAFDVLGDLIAKVSGTTFEDYVKNNILNPLSMNNSTLLLKETNPKLLVSPHILDSTYQVSVSTIFPYNRIHAPSSTLYSNIRDMSKWMIANMNKGELDGARILNPSSYELMWHQVNEQWQDAGLGCFLGEYRGYKTVGHSGGDVGFATNLIMIPEKSIGIIIMSNYQRAAVQQITNVALDVALHLETKPLKGIVNLSLDKILYQTIIKEGEKAAIEKFNYLNEHADPNFDFNQVRQLNTLGSNLIKQGRVKDAITIFKLNIEIYPSMAFLYRHLAETYVLNGDKELAIKTYKKILELNPGDEKTSKMLNNLINEQK